MMSPIQRPCQLTIRSHVTSKTPMPIGIARYTNGDVGGEI